MNILIQLSFLLNYPWHIQVRHLLNVHHLETTHRFSLGGLEISNIQRFEDRVCFDSISRHFLLNLFRKQVTQSAIYIESLLSYRLEINPNIIVLFKIDPIAESHLFTVEVHTTYHWLINWLLQPFVSMAIWLTIYEDLEFWRGSHHGI